MASFDEIRSEFFPYRPTSEYTVHAVDADTVHAVFDKFAGEVFSPMTGAFLSRSSKQDSWRRACRSTNGGEP